MKVLYVAADGRMFDERKQCIDYEDYVLMAGIDCYDDDWDIVSPFAEHALDTLVTVDVRPTADLDRFHSAIARDGKPEFLMITEPGRWYWLDGRFVKQTCQ